MRRRARVGSVRSPSSRSSVNAPTNSGPVRSSTGTSSLIPPEPRQAPTRTRPGSCVSCSVSALLPPGFSLHAELAMYVAEGLTPLNALQSATLNPAKLWHATDSLGTVAPGKLADLVLLDADPLADITNTTTVRAVVANGRYYDRAALDQLVAAVQTKAKQEPTPLGNTR